MPSHQAIFSIVIVTLLAGASATAQTPDSHAARHKASLAAAQQGVAASTEGTQYGAWVRLGDAELRSGDCVSAVKHFEQAIAARPASEPYLWQYGIALYFVGRYADGRALFEKHRVVNPNDVENAAWHLLCAAKETNIGEARKILLPAPADRRPPMKQILTRLRGGDATEIEAAVTEFKDTPAHASARFYADLYLGLIADAEGRPAQARRYMQRAAATPATDYMADVARVYSQSLQSESQP